MLLYLEELWKSIVGYFTIKKKDLLYISNFKNVQDLFFDYVYVCMSACGYVHECWNLWRPEASDSPELELQTAIICLMWVPGVELCSFWKSSMNSLLLSHFSAQQVTLNSCRV